MNKLNEMSDVLMFNRFEVTNLQFTLMGIALIAVVIVLIYLIDNRRNK